MNSPSANEGVCPHGLSLALSCSACNGIEARSSKQVIERLREVIATHDERGFTSCVVSDSDLRVLLDAADRAAPEPRAEHPPELMAVVDRWQDEANAREKAAQKNLSNASAFLYQTEASLIGEILQDVRRAAQPPTTMHTCEERSYCDPCDDDATRTIAINKAATALRECVASGYGLNVEEVDAVRLVKILSRAGNWQLGPLPPAVIYDPKDESIRQAASPECYELVGWQYKFATAWGGFEWCDSQRPRNGSSCVESREIYARVPGTKNCPHGLPLADNVCGPCSEGRPNRPADEKPVSQCQLDGCIETRTIGGRHCIGHETRACTCEARLFPGEVGHAYNCATRSQSKNTPQD